VLSKLEEEELISLIFEYVWNNRNKMNPYNTDYERCIALMTKISNEVLERCHQKWKEEGKNGK
jgi:hypothetical protein